MVVNGKISVKEKRKVCFIAIEYITHIASSGYLSIIHTTEGKRFIVSKLLKFFESYTAAAGMCYGFAVKKLDS